MPGPIAGCLSCAALQFALRVNVLEVQADVLLGRLEQFRHVLLLWGLVRSVLDRRADIAQLSGGPPVLHSSALMFPSTPGLGVGIGLMGSIALMRLIGWRGVMGLMRHR